VKRASGLRNWPSDPTFRQALNSVMSEIDPDWYEIETQTPDGLHYPGVHRPGKVYFARLPGQGIKIGFSVNPERRMKDLQIGASASILLVGTVEGTMTDEARFHERFHEHRIRGEWFSERILPDVLEIVGLALTYPHGV
jgi:hypothetical protein